jgi:EAL and modified HD-GYP domain-containing signal transduction protein
MSDKIFIGKQAILDKDGEIEAYELLFRDGKKGYADVSDNKKATARVLSNALNQFGIRQLTGGVKAFINTDETIILSDFMKSIPKDNFVIELLETTKVTPELINRIALLKDEGYTFAIDDYTGKYKRIFAPVMQYISIVKLEIMDIPLEDIEGEVKDLLRINPYINILAEKIEDRKTFEVCKKAGCTLFQGYFFSKPTIIEGKNLDPSSMAVLALFNAISSDEETSKIVKLFDKHPKLMLSLFKYLNSRDSSLDNIRTINNAINLLGREALQNWVALLMFSGLNDEEFTEPIFEMALNRSKIMKALATKLWGTKNQELIESAGLVGVLSLMDAITSVSMKDILKEVHVSNEIKKALLDFEGNLGKLLYLAKFLEQENEDFINQVSSKLNISFDALLDIKTQAYLN